VRDAGNAKFVGRCCHLASGDQHDAEGIDGGTSSV
jgi:hypothetical protein